MQMSKLLLLIEGGSPLISSQITERVLMKEIPLYMQIRQHHLLQFITQKLSLLCIYPLPEERLGFLEAPCLSGSTQVLLLDVTTTRNACI